MVNLSLSELSEHSLFLSQNVTRSHEMSFNLKFGNFRYLHVSNLQVLLVILVINHVSAPQNVDVMCF